MSSLDQLFQNNKLITFVGTGGVGKTSLSIATAIQASKSGKRVAAVTVDPSRRLTSLLGLEDSNLDSTTVEWESLDNPIDIFYVSPDEVFTGFVAEHLSKDLFEKLEANGIFKQISKNLRETHNFSALYKMYQIFESQKYDLIILDTPPCHQVVDFFESPERLKRFFSERDQDKEKSWVGWIQQKGLSVAETFLKKLVGEDFVNEMENFFQAVGGLRKSIHQVTEKFMTVLGQEDSRLIIVFPPAGDKIDEAQYLKQQIANMNYRVDGYVMNRAYPKDLDQSEEVSLAQDSYEKKLYDYYRAFHQDSKTLLSQLKTKESSDLYCATVPDFSLELKSKEDILEFSNLVGENWESI